MTEREGVVTDDVWLASYLLARGAHLGEPIVERDGQVTFRVVGPEVDADAERFVRGQAVASVHALKTGMQLARDFIAATKRARNGARFRNNERNGESSASRHGGRRGDGRSHGDRSAQG